MDESNVPQLVDKMGGSYSTIAPKLEDEVTTNDDEMVEVKVLLALSKDKRMDVGKNHARNDEWVRIYQKSQENSQKRASTDTRIKRVQKEAKDSKPKPEKSNPQSNPVNMVKQKVNQ
ncbi:hypothetical protein Tco_0714252 [Tanacetum coccineum]